MKRQTVRVALALFAVLSIVAGVMLWQQQTQRQQAAQLRALVARLGLEPLRAEPVTNAAQVQLGQLLFFEKEMSGNRDVSCATCHHPQMATTDHLALSIGPGGHGLGAARQPDLARRVAARNAPDLFNRSLAQWQSLFWDGRVSRGSDGQPVTPAGSYLPQGLDSLLAAQAMFPVTFRDEMRGGWYDTASYASEPGASEEGPYRLSSGGWYDEDVFGQPNELAALGNGPEQLPVIWTTVTTRLLDIPAYRQLFREAYPSTPLQEISYTEVANALAAFQAQAFTLVDSPWNRYLAGEEQALTAEAKAGALLFFGEAQCAGCHTPLLFTDQEFHNIGAPQLGSGQAAAYVPLDHGRFVVTGAEADRFAFRTPSLLNVALTGPWLHNGAYDSLEVVVRHHLHPQQALRDYDGRHLPDYLQNTVQNEEVTVNAILQTLDPQLQEIPQLGDGEVRALVAFLEALTAQGANDLSHLVPEAVPSGLPVGE
jgi:cytochrome c peroxidase